MWWILLHLIIISQVFAFGASKPNIDIDYEKNCFTQNQKCFQYISGTFHYFRTHPDQWEDRIIRMKAGGLNAVQTYIAWNYHEKYQGDYDFSGDKNITYFFELIKKHKMYAILRPGPYIDAEWEFGGFPYYLLNKRPNINLRSSKDSFYMESVERWYRVLLPILVPYIYGNGGPIISVQIENEFGSAHLPDFPYTSLLVNLTFEYFGRDVLCFTTDGDWDAAIQHGSIPNCYPGVDFGAGSAYKGFYVLRKHNPGGPFLNSEYYTGWFTGWGENRTIQNVNSVTSTFNKMLYMRANINLYVYEGGTNWAFYAGGYINHGILTPVITSYGYSAPLSEGGEFTPLYFAIRNSVSKYLGWSLPDVPPPVVNVKYPKIGLSKPMNIYKFFKFISNGSVSAKYPLGFEEVHQPYGFLLYTMQREWIYGGNFTLKSVVADIGHIYINMNYFGAINHSNPSIHVPIKNVKSLAILVENQGRSCNDVNHNFKGLLSNVTISKNNLTTILENWIMTRIEFSSLSVKSDMDLSQTGRGVYFGELVLSEEPSSTYLNMANWGRGMVFVNGVNLGRYWSVGPQYSLYLPYPYLRKGTNNFIVVEFEPAVAQNHLEFYDNPIWS